jgi:hypothetical protein
MKDVNAEMTRSMVLGILTKPDRHEWTLQGFGMLRCYLSNSLRLHVWDGRHRVPNVTDVHDHPWNFVSLVVSGRIVDTRYKVFPCSHTEEQVERQRLRQPFLKSTIVCGVNAGNHVAAIKERGERVWLMPLEPEDYTTGCCYERQASEVHHTSYSNGTVTLVKRDFLPDTEHAHVFFPADQEWVSAEPRIATRAEVVDICEAAIVAWDNR